MQKIEIDNWNRKQIYEHFKTFADPYFSVLVPVEVTQTYTEAKAAELPFFAVFLHRCLAALNEVEAMRTREINGEVVIFDTIHASTTMMRVDNTIAFTLVHFDANMHTFVANYLSEKERVKQTNSLFPPKSTLGCIYCSAIPWLAFTGHKEPKSGSWDTVPRLAFSKREQKNNKYYMNVSVEVNHAFVDGLHVSQFIEIFQNKLNKKI